MRQPEYKGVTVHEKGSLTRRCKTNQTAAPNAVPTGEGNGGQGKPPVTSGAGRVVPPASNWDPRWVDFITTGAALFGSTYMLCSSTYLMPFVFANAGFFIISAIAKNQDKKGYPTGEWQIYRTLLFSTVVMSSIFGFNAGTTLFINSIASSLPSYLPAFAFSTPPVLVSYASYLSSFVLQRFVIDSFTVGVIPTLCQGLVDRFLSIRYEDPVNINKSYSDSYACLNAAQEFVGHIFKYSIHRTLALSNVLLVPAAGAVKQLVTYGFSTKGPENPLNPINWLNPRAICEAIRGAINYSLYQISYGPHTLSIFPSAVATALPAFIDIYGGIFRVSLPGFGIEVIDKALATQEETFLARLEARRAERLEAAATYNEIQ
jgi:hypothetical protein